jgi:hypothetical protein
VRRKQLIRTVAYKRRAEMILRLTDRYTGSNHWPCRLRVEWAPIMPQDRARDAETDAVLVDRGIISRATAGRHAGVERGEEELQRWLTETNAIQATGSTLAQTPEPRMRDVIDPP